MFDELVECIVKRNITTKAYIQRIVMLAVDGLTLSVAFLVFINFPAFILLILLALIIMGFVTYFVFRNTDLEYEYDFFQNEMTVDKIMHRGARKRLGVYSFSRMELMAPETSGRFHGVSVKDENFFDYSANNPDLVNYIAVLYDEKGNVARVDFTPNEELLEAIKKSCPRKVFSD